MELKKKKYKRKEVESLLSVFKITYEARLSEQKTIVLDLNKEIATLKAQLSNYQQKDNIIVSTMENATKSAQNLKERASLQYSLELERLKQFSNRWQKYLEELKEKYPLYEPISKAIDINEEINAISLDQEPKDAVENLDDKLIDIEMNKPFNPKAKIHEYIAATGINGFNIEEVLNPGDLELEELCKELGLMEPEE